MPERLATAAGRPSAVRPARHRAARAVPADLTGALWPLAALVVVALAGARTLRGVPLPDDGALTAPAAELLRGTSDRSLVSPDGLAGLHTAVYATVTRAFERHATLAGAGRELLLVLLIASAALVWRTARRCGLGHPAGAVAVLAFGAVPLLVPAHAVSTPAALAVGWLLLAAWLVAGGRPARAGWSVAAVAAVLGTLLAPDALLLGTAGLAGAVATGRLVDWAPPSRRLGTAGALTVAAVALRAVVGRWDPQPGDPGRWSAGTLGLLIVTAALLAVAVLAAVVLPQVRPPAVALGATTLLAVAPPSGRLPALLLCLPVAALLLAAVLERAVRAAAHERPGRQRAGRLAVAVTVAAGGVAAVVGLVATPRSDLGAAAHRQLLGWVDEQLPAGARLATDAALHAELLHAGGDEARLETATDVQVAATAPGAPLLRVVRGEPPRGGLAVARFDPADGLAALTVVQPRPVSPDAGAAERRRALADALLANPQTVAPGPVAEVLAAGEVDPRLLTLLAGIGAQFGVGIDSLPAVPGEEGRTPARQAVIASTGGAALADDPARAERLIAWVGAQRPPYAPDTVRMVDDGLLLTYRYLPDPDGAVARAGGR